MDTSPSTETTPEHIIQPHTRFTRQDGWELDDISLCSSGNIAVSGHKDCYPYRSSFVCVYSTVDNSDSRDKPTLLYDKEFEDKDSVWPPWRRISFLEPNSTEIVTCRNDEVQVIDYNREVVLRSRKVNGETSSLSVSESQIFIGLDESDIVNIYDKDLNRIKSIRLKEIRGDDYPCDMTAAADRLYVCTYYDRAIVYSQNSGSILTEYNTGNRAYSVTVNVQIAVVAVLWSGWPKIQVAVYSLTDNNCSVVFDVESGVSRIRISDQGRIVTGNEDTGEVKIYDLPQIFTFNNLKVTLSSLFTKYDVEELVKYCKISDDSLEDDSGGRRDDKKAARLLSALEEKGLFEDGKFQYLKEAFSHLGSCYTSKFMNLLDFYQRYADKNRANQTQASDSNESGHKLLDGFSSDWTACDMSLSSSGMAIVSGHSSIAKKTSLDFIWKNDSDSWGSWVKTRELDGGSESEYLVSFIDEYRLVTCCGNVVEIINCDTDETDIRVSLQSSGCASCIAVRDQDVYVGFKESSTILVLNRDLQEKGTVTLKEVKNMWPVDLAVTPGKLLLCLKKNTNSQVLLFKEKDGQKVVQYRNIEDETQTPLSVAVSEESDLVGILWSTYVEECDGQPYGHISLHSLTHGYCLSFVAVAVTIHEFECDCCEINEGCSSGKRVRFLSGHLAVMDDLGGVKFFDKEEVFSEENLSYALSRTLASEGHEGFRSLVDDRDTSYDSDGSSSGSDQHVNDNEFKDDGISRVLQKMSKLFKILAILTENGYLNSESVTHLREKFSQCDGSYDEESLRVIDSDGEEVQCCRFQWQDDDYEDDEYATDVDVCIGASNELAVSHLNKGTCERFICIYLWEKNKKMQPSLKFYKRFDNGRSKLFVSLLDGWKAVTCCDDLIEITDFGSHAKISKSHKMNSPGTCMATKDGDIYIGSKSSEIVVFDSVLAEKKTITVVMKSGEWPFDLTVIPGKLFMCTAGASRRALSFSAESGLQIMEYTYQRSQAYERANPASITVSESLDLVGISWFCDRKENYETVSVITLHSLSRGYCVSFLANYSAHIIRLLDEGCITTGSKGVEYHLLDQMISFENWKAGLADFISLSEYKMLRKFYQISLEEIDDEVDGEDQDYPWTYYIVRKKGLMNILTKKGCITASNVSSLRDAFAGLGNFYRNTFYQPVEAYIKYTSKTSIPAGSVPPSTHSSNVAESLLQLRYSTQCQSNITSVNAVSQQSSLIQCYPRQLSTNEGLTSLPTVPRVTPTITCLASSAGKRPVGDGDHSATAVGLHEKRAKTVETTSFMGSSDSGSRETSNTYLYQLLAQTPQTPSLLQLMEGDPPPNYTNLNMYSSMHPLMSRMSPGPAQVQMQPSAMTAGKSNQSSVGTSGLVSQLGLVGTQRIGQVMGTHIQMGLEVQSQTNLQGGCLAGAAQQGYSSTAQQGFAGITSQHNQTVTLASQSLTHQVPLHSGQTVPADVRQHISPPQFQPVEQHTSLQRHEISGRQITSLEQRPIVGKQDAKHVAQSFTPRMALQGNLSPGPCIADSLGGPTTPQTFHQTGAERNVQPEQRRDLSAEQDIQQSIQLQQQNNSLEGQARGRSIEQQQPSSQPGTICNTNETHRTQCESATSSQGIPEEMKTAVELCVQKCVTPLFRDINNKLKHLLGSSSSQYPHQDIPGTSSQSGSNVSCSVVHDRDSPDNEPDDEVRTAWESLSEYNRMSLQAFRGMTDDRAEVVRRLVEMVLTDEERRNRNCFGKSGKQKLDDNKLRKIRHITFYLCPIISKNTDSDKLSLEDLEWKRLCEVIDKANRHYREKLKRQGRRR